jgi:hypothetical protein
MTATNHALTGALIAVSIKNPALAITAAFASHFALDVLPHFGLRKEIEYLKKSILLRLVVVFELIAMSFALFYLPAHLNHLASGAIVLACMVVAVLPDFMWTYRYAKRFITHDACEFKSKFMHYHEKIQTFERPIGIVVELVWIAIFLPPILRLAV